VGIGFAGSVKTDWLSQKPTKLVGIGFAGSAKTGRLNLKFSKFWEILK
jgi:hypothetical protein